MIIVKCYASGSSGNCYLVRNEDTIILLECGIETTAIRKFLKQEGVLISSLSACLISHKHKDHCLSLNYISKFTDIYTTNELNSIYNYIYNSVSDNKFSVGSIRIKPIKLYHGKCENYGFIFKDNDNCIFFGTDFSYMESDLTNFKFDKIYIECNYLKEYLENNLESENERKYIRQINTHMELENLISTLHKCFNLDKCKQINLIHISQDVGNAPLFVKRIEEEFDIKTIALRSYDDNNN